MKREETTFEVQVLIRGTWQPLRGGEFETAEEAFNHVDWLLTPEPGIVVTYKREDLRVMQITTTRTPTIDPRRPAWAK